MANFFAFLKYRGEPETCRSVWAPIAYFQHKRPDLLTLYDIRVAKQNKPEDKSDKAGRKIPLYKFYERAKKIHPSYGPTKNSRNRI